MNKHFFKFIPMVHASVVAVPLIIQTLIPMVRAKLGVARRRKKTSDGVHKAYAERRFLRATKLGTIAHASVAATPLILLLLTGCVTGTQHHALSQEQQVKLRSVQTRKFRVSDKKQMMQAVMSTLQDLGFAVEKADYDLGLVTATRLAGSTLRITVTVRPHGREMVVRANARRNLSSITSPEPYQLFFRSLNRSAFLEDQRRAPQTKPTDSLEL